MKLNVEIYPIQAICSAPEDGWNGQPGYSEGCAALIHVMIKMGLASRKFVIGPGGKLNCHISIFNSPDITDGRKISYLYSAVES